jgi:transposase-like protein
LSKLTHNQKRLLHHHLVEDLKRNDTENLINECKGDDVSCPYCECENIGKWGMASGLQRFKCKNESCGKTFNALTNTPLARLRKRDVWAKNLECMLDGLPIRRVAELLGVAETTAFRWRHRFLKAPSTRKPSEVAGIIEADEMFFAESFKGNQTIYNRKPRKRGGMGDKRTLEDKVPVLIVVDRNGGLTDFVLEQHSSNDIHEAMRPIVNRDSILCSDGAHAYRSFAKEANIKHYRTIVSKGERVIGGQFHIQNVNGYMSRLRSWMSRFRGVGTAYLPNYLGWMRMMDGRANKFKEIQLNYLINENFSFPTDVEV